MQQQGVKASVAYGKVLLYSLNGDFIGTVKNVITSLAEEHKHTSVAAGTCRTQSFVPMGTSAFLTTTYQISNLTSKINKI